MQVGDLVRRKNIWAEWQEHNTWMTHPEYKELGLIVKWQGVTERFVFWTQTGLSWADEDELVLVSKETVHL